MVVSARRVRAVVVWSSICVVIHLWTVPPVHSIYKGTVLSEEPGGLEVDRAELIPEKTMRQDVSARPPPLVSVHQPVFPLLRLPFFPVKVCRGLSESPTLMGVIMRKT
jgi:hypothetical protein